MSASMQPDSMFSAGQTPCTWLVTGAAGFIGSHVSQHLIARGQRVVGFDNFDGFYDREVKDSNIARIRQTVAEASDSKPQQDQHQFDLVEGDILNRSMLMEVTARYRPDMIVHVAALAGVRPSLQNPERYMRVNMEGLGNMLDAARAVRPLARGRTLPGILFASSSSVYGNNVKVPFGEDDHVNEPISPYAASKRAGELLCETYARVYGLRIAALRFFTVFGPAQRPDLAIAKFMKRIALGQSIEMFGDGTTSRDYTYIDDIVQGMLAAADAVTGRRREAAAGEVDGGGYFRIFNLGGSRPHALTAMIETISRTVGKPARITREPMQNGDVERTWADLARSSRELGFNPTTSFEDGVKKQWAWLERECSVLR